MTAVHKLNIPYHSQWDPDAMSHTSDCGPTCLAMLLNAYGKWVTPDTLYQFIPYKKSHQFVTMSELMIAGKQNQLPFAYKRYANQYDALTRLLRLIDEGFAPIALVKYKPWKQFTGNDFNWGHFVVVTGYDANHIFINDPLFGLSTRRDRGANLPMPRALFLNGWGGFPATENPNYVVIHPQRSLTPSQSAPKPVTPPKKVTPQPAPTPATKPSQPAYNANLAKEDARRIRAFAAYLHADEPNLGDPKEVEFWMSYIGNWGKQSESYRVQSGDTLGVIAYKFYNASGRWQTIRSYNYLKTDRIWVGQWLKIPLHDAANSHLSSELRELVSTSSRGFGSSSTTSESADAQAANLNEALDYDALGKHTVGIGFIDDDTLNALDG
ncbi:MAG: C39 family peptidase [Candidatus Promineifilaceae bacterium]